MTTIDFSPLFRHSVGFDRLASLLDNTLQYNQSGNGYPPYNIEAVDETRYTISLAVAGFSIDELEIQVEQGVLSVSGKKTDNDEGRKYLYQGIANRGFERKFQLADHVEVTGAKLTNGLLSIDLVKELPETMKPKQIPIGDEGQRTTIEHHNEQAQGQADKEKIKAA